MNVLDDKELEKKSEEELVEQSEEKSEEKSEELDGKLEEEDLDQHLAQWPEEDKGTEDKGVHDEVAVQGGFTHGNVGQLVVSFNHIFFLYLFCNFL